jgi:hypothetical protein
MGVFGQTVQSFQQKLQRNVNLHVDTMWVREKYTQIQRTHHLLGSNHTAGLQGAKLTPNLFPNITAVPACVVSIIPI